MIFHDVEQNSDPWFELRLGKVTGSKLPVIMAHDGKAFGDPAKDYALQLALELATGRRAPRSFSNDHMERGHEEEPLARMAYEEMFFCEVTNGGFFDHGTHGDSPDGLINHDGVVEIKAVVAKTHEATRKRGSFDPAYRWQMVGHIEDTRRQWCDFVSFCPDFPDDMQLLVYRLHRADCLDAIARLNERRAEFIETLVLPKYEELRNGRRAA